MSSKSSQLEMIAAGRRRFIRIAGTLISLSALDLVGCGGGSANNSDGGKTTAKVLGANTMVTAGSIEFPAGFTANPGPLTVLNAYSRATAGTDLTFSQTIIASSPSLVFVQDTHSAVIFIGYLDPTSKTNVINALSSAVALLYFAFDFQAFPEANRPQLLSLIQENTATVALANIIAQRVLVNTAALSQSDAQITASLLDAYESFTAMGSAPSAVSQSRALVPAVHDTPTVNPLLLIQPSATTHQSGFSISQVTTSDGFTGTNYFRRECVIYVYKTATGTPDPTTGIVPPLEEALLIGTPVKVPPTQKLGIFNAITDVFYGAAPWTPLTTNAIPLTLDSGAQRTVYQIVVLGGGAQNRTPQLTANPSFFADPLFVPEAAEWTTTTKALFLKTWLIDIFMGTVLEMAGTPTVLSTSLDAAADALLEINDTAWQAALDEFLEGNIPGAIAGLYNSLTTNSTLMEEVLTILVNVINAAAGGLVLNTAKAVLTEAGHIILGVLEGLNIAFVAADVLAVSHDLNASNIGEIWTATLTAPTISLNPAKASIQPGQSVVFTVKLPIGLVPPAGSTTVYDWTQNGTLSALTDGGKNTGTASIETPLTVVTLTTTPSEQAATITVGVTAYFVDASGNKTSVGSAAPASVTLSAAQSGAFGIHLATNTMSVFIPESSNGLIPARTVYYIWVWPYFTFAEQQNAATYQISNPGLLYLYNSNGSPETALTASQIAAFASLTDVSDFPLNGTPYPYDPGAPGGIPTNLSEVFGTNPVNLGTGLIGIASNYLLTSPASGSFGGESGLPFAEAQIDPYVGDGSTAGDLTASIASLKALVMQQMEAIPAAQLPTFSLTYQP
jgi:hypothetical protein